MAARPSGKIAATEKEILGLWGEGKLSIHSLRKPRTAIPRCPSRLDPNLQSRRQLPELLCLRGFYRDTANDDHARPGLPFPFRRFRVCIRLEMGDRYCVDLGTG